MIALSIIGMVAVMALGGWMIAFGLSAIVLGGALGDSNPVFGGVAIATGVGVILLAAYFSPLRLVVA